MAGVNSGAKLRYMRAVWLYLAISHKKSLALRGQAFLRPSLLAQTKKKKALVTMYLPTQAKGIPTGTRRLFYSL